MGGDIIDELRWRGLIAQTTDEAALRDALAGGPVTFYCGFDPTAASLHVGNLVQILTARRLQLAGHRPIMLVGGATGLIGDPKETGERVLRPAEVVAGWVDRLRAQIAPLLSNDAATAPVFVNNLDWTSRMSAIELLRDVGKHFSVNRMLDRQAVAARLAGGGISYTEFSYVLLQANDFLELFRRHGCTLQFGGADQWGNMTAGADLIRRVEGARVHVLSTPLLVKADGTKFGKTESGTVWLDASLTSPYAFYQFWLNTEDRDLLSYLKTFSFRSPAQIDELARQTQVNPAARAGARALAEELTTLVHGPQAAAAAIAASQALFGHGDLADLDEGTLADALAELPRVTVCAPPPPYVQLLADTGLVPSRSAARRTVAEGGAWLNNTRVTDPDYVPGPADLLAGRWLLLRRGRRALAAVEVTPS